MSDLHEYYSAVIEAEHMHTVKGWRGRRPHLSCNPVHGDKKLARDRRIHEQWVKGATLDQLVQEHKLRPQTIQGILRALNWRKLHPRREE